MTKNIKIIGPFREIVTMANLPNKGPLSDNQLEVTPEGGIVTDGSHIIAVGSFSKLSKNYPNAAIDLIEEDLVALPGFVDAHTHICFAGSRAMDFAERNAGTSYLEIAKKGGGIWSTVKHTRAASEEQLVALMQTRIKRLLENGVTTVEIKSGYGLNVEEELKMLRAIQVLKQKKEIDIVATCLAAHIVPKDIEGGETEYLKLILNELVPVIQEQKLASRFDIFIEESAFSTAASKLYLNELKNKGFDLTVHGDQFSTGGSAVAVECGALSVDHLEASGEKEISMLAKSSVIPVALPGASIGIGCAFTPARKLLDAGSSLAIASDWNPGSAPQGNLLSQAAILATFQKLTSAEVFAGITFRAAQALNLSNKGRIAKGFDADIIAFPGKDYREILYQQGSLKVKRVWKA